MNWPLNRVTTRPLWTLAALLLTCASAACGAEPVRPNIVLVMADDMGWGQTGYNGHPLLKTPHLDAMAANSLRLDRFYAGGPVCSPTRATVMTGRTHERSGVLTHGYALNSRERTIAQALTAAGYLTGHFGKWHLDGFRGAGAPILATDDHSPGVFGFRTWLSMTNFFDRDPLMSREGEFEEFTGDSSEIIVAEALEFITATAAAKQPFFTVIWYGSPHNPFHASEEDAAPFSQLDRDSRDHYGELVALDRSVGTLRDGLQKLGLRDNTLVWFCSDNGGLPKISPDTVGGLRGNKGSLYEGGLRVPCLIEWPAGIPQPRVSQFPACTTDIFPTVADVLDLPEDVFVTPIDGQSIAALFTQELSTREKPLGFRYSGKLALIDGTSKLVLGGTEKSSVELFDLAADRNETTNLSDQRPDERQRLAALLTAWSDSVDASARGADYPAGTFDPDDADTRDWVSTPEYAPHLSRLQQRPEYRPAAPRKKAPAAN